MKKIITCIVAATAICLSASAQTEDNSREEQLEQELDDARTELDNLKLKQKYKEIWGKALHQPRICNRTDRNRFRPG